jgi:DNA-directed RNA polymerase subunit RPC12/RpoP
MKLGMRFSQRQSQELELGQKLCLSLKMRQKLHFGDFVSTPKGICPNCRHQLDEKEIKAGFSDDPQELRTTCPNCSHKFLAHLIITRKNEGGKVEEVIYLCKIQALDQLLHIKQKRGRIGIAYLAKNDRQLFYNIIRHWGSYSLGLKALKNYGEHH